MDGFATLAMTPEPIPNEKIPLWAPFAKVADSGGEGLQGAIGSTGAGRGDEGEWVH